MKSHIVIILVLIALSCFGNCKLLNRYIENSVWLMIYDTAMNYAQSKQQCENLGMSLMNLSTIPYLLNANVSRYMLQETTATAFFFKENNMTGVLLANDKSSKSILVGQHKFDIKHILCVNKTYDSSTSVIPAVIITAGVSQAIFIIIVTLLYLALRMVSINRRQWIRIRLQNGSLHKNDINASQQKEEEEKSIGRGSYQSSI